MKIWMEAWRRIQRMPEEMEALRQARSFRTLRKETCSREFPLP